MLFLLIDKIKKYVNRASDDAHLLAIVVAFIAWISYCNYKERMPIRSGTETFDLNIKQQQQQQQQQRQPQQQQHRI